MLLTQVLGKQVQNVYEEQFSLTQKFFALYFLNNSVNFAFKTICNSCSS